MSFDKFTKHVMTTLEFVSSVALAYHIYLFAGCSILMAILSWVALQFIHTIFLIVKADKINVDDTDALTELIHRYNPFWFAINIFSIIALSYFI